MTYLRDDLQQWKILEILFGKTTFLIRARSSQIGRFTRSIFSHHNKSRKLAQNWNFLSKTLILGREKARKGKIALQKWKNNYLSFHTVSISLQSLVKYRRYEHFKNKMSKKITFLVNKTRFFFQIIFFLAFRYYVVR